MSEYEPHITTASGSFFDDASSGSSLAPAAAAASLTEGAHAEQPTLSPDAIPLAHYVAAYMDGIAQHLG